MMLWFNSHRRFQEQLSAYIDAELPERDALALDAHLQSCDACATELDELRLASAALQELPDVDAPRSFALSPSDVALPARQAGVRSINSGLRLTGAALAAALAVLLVLDVGGIGGGDEETREGDTPFFSASIPESADDQALKGITGVPTSGMNAAGSDLLTEPSTPEANATPAGSDSGGEGAGGGVGDSGGGSEPAPGGEEATNTPVSDAVAPVPPVEESPPDSEQSNPPTDVDGAPASIEPATGEDTLRAPPMVTPTPTEAPGDAAAELGLNGLHEQDTETLTTSDASLDSDDGPSALLVTEIVLAALLGASIVGVAAATYAERRRR